jgi:hypothetical protein
LFNFFGCNAISVASVSTRLQGRGFTSYGPTRRHIPDDLDLRQRRCSNHKSRVFRGVSNSLLCVVSCGIGVTVLGKFAVCGPAVLKTKDLAGQSKLSNV